MIKENRVLINSEVFPIGSLQKNIIFNK